MTGQKKLNRLVLSFALVLFLLTGNLQAQDNGGYQRPPEVIAKLIDAPSTPSVSIDAANGAPRLPQHRRSSSQRAAHSRHTYRPRQQRPQQGQAHDRPEDEESLFR